MYVSYNIFFPLNLEDRAHFPLRWEFNRPKVVDERILKLESFRGLAWLLNFDKMGLFRIYLRTLNQFPVATNCVTTSVLMSSGDVVAQKVIEERKSWDRERTTRFAIIGACLFGPCCTIWYRYLDKFVLRLKVPKPYHGLTKTVSTTLSRACLQGGEG